MVGLAHALGQRTVQACGLQTIFVRPDRTISISALVPALISEAEHVFGQEFAVFNTNARNAAVVDIHHRNFALREGNAVQISEEGSVSGKRFRGPGDLRTVLLLVASGHHEHGALAGVVGEFQGEQAGALRYAADFGREIQITAVVHLKSVGSGNGLQGRYRGQGRGQVSGRLAVARHRDDLAGGQVDSTNTMVLFVGDKKPVFGVPQRNGLRRCEFGAQCITPSAVGKALLPGPGQDFSFAGAGNDGRRLLLGSEFFDPGHEDHVQSPYVQDPLVSGGR